MHKRFFCIIFAILISFNFSYSSQIDVNTYVYEDYTIFNYVITLDNNFTSTKFTIQKPKDGQISYLVDKNGPVEYRVLGDKLTFEPKDVTENVFLIKIISQETSQEIFYTDSFRTYIGFNTQIDVLNYNLMFKENFGELIDVFPKNYTIENDKYSWTLKDLTQESLFVVNFNKLAKKNNTILYIAIGLGMLLLLFIIIFSIIYIRYRNTEKKKERLKVRVKEELKKEISIKEDTSQIEEIVEPEDTLEDFIEKNLTQNEKQLVLLIKDHEGISQYDILNHLPKLTKSNLSKIISKLHARKILKRIKVGKVNKIHLGSKFEKNHE